ncbi:MAG: hypothetical protein AAGI38_17690 [Bacteroidota bacterium]
MTLDELQHILLTGSWEEKEEALTNPRAGLPDREVFALLFEHLKHTNSQIRFFALFQLIRKFHESLTTIDETLVGDIYTLIFDENIPVSDRAIWALSITGDKGLDVLLESYPSATVNDKIKITYAVGKGYFSYRSKDRMNLMLAGLTSNDPQLRFTAMCTMMSNTPVGRSWNNPWNSTEDKSIDFEEVYKIVLPVARDFSQIENNTYREFATRYINWIEGRGRE